MRKVTTMSVSPVAVQTVQIAGYRASIRVTHNLLPNTYSVNFLVDPQEDDLRTVKLYAVTADNMEFDHEDPEEHPIEFVGTVELAVPIFVFAQAL